MEHFKETEWSGFFVGSNGTIKNQTGIKFVQYAQDGVMYVGIELDRNKRVMKRLKDLVYRYHINSGKPIPPGLVVDFKDKNKSNCKADNLYIRFSTNKGVYNEMDIDGSIPGRVFQPTSTKNNR